ncbi:TIGR03915 family putative DNA repair protein [Allomuricauda sp. NBRC 101325]|uniref:TIGR03915 family putative DNA repair protein n=1 Tax=Allomuricauda sp. NBRC 101325 TaxID=1113758 RepID=UPI0024A5154E|nr:TIGR03915 family putative DNA repair protein [Muricauda sp. NBRC 101325]GLU44677.1 hypothetical protein Musp01_23010 [Muricauda sp. NBRC 101325]
MESSTTLIYDGSFNGFLTAVYVAFDEKLTVADIQKNNQSQNELFSDTQTIFTHIENAKRVWNGIRNMSYNAISYIYFAFLSETEGIEMILYTYIQKLMLTKNGNTLDYSDGSVAYMEQLSKKVRNEKHFLENHLRFSKTKDCIHFAQIKPNFNVLPLISKHYRNRFTDQQWLIFDAKRNYGIYYSSGQMEMVTLSEIISLDKKSVKNTILKELIKSKLHTPKSNNRYHRSFSEQKEAV